MEFYVFFISSNGTIDFKTILASSKNMPFHTLMK